MESLEALNFKCLLVLRTYFTALETRALISLPLVGRFLAPWNLTHPAPPLRAVDQVDFKDLDYAIMTLYKCMS